MSGCGASRGGRNEASICDGAAALDVLVRAVPFSATCLAQVDPETRLISGDVKWGGLGDERDEVWASCEYEGPDLYIFLTVA
jgi:hypothetical protein